MHVFFEKRVENERLWFECVADSTVSCCQKSTAIKCLFFEWFDLRIHVFVENMVEKWFFLNVWRWMSDRMYVLDQKMLE